MSAAEELVKTWFRRVWEEEDATAIDEMMASDTKAVGLGGHDLVGPEEFKQLHSALLSLIADNKFTFDKIIESGEWISVLCTMTGKSRETGKDVVMTGSAMIRTGDGKLLEGYNHFDFMGLFAQLELLPTNSFELGLVGQKIG